MSKSPFELSLKTWKPWPENDDYPITRSRGTKEANEALIESYRRATTRFDACLDSTASTIAIELRADTIRWQEMKDKGVRLRIITEITKENVEECTQLTRLCEIRRLGGTVGNFIVTDREYIAANRPPKSGEPLSDILCISHPEVVEQQSRMFELLWQRSIPVEQRMAQLVRGSEIGETRVLNDIKQTLDEIIETTMRARKEILILYPHGRSCKEKSNSSIAGEESFVQGNKGEGSYTNLIVKSNTRGLPIHRMARNQGG